MRSYSEVRGMDTLACGFGGWGGIIQSLTVIVHQNSLLSPGKEERRQIQLLEALDSSFSSVPY